MIFYHRRLPAAVFPVSVRQKIGDLFPAHEVYAEGKAPIPGQSKVQRAITSARLLYAAFHYLYDVPMVECRPTVA